MSTFAFIHGGGDVGWYWHLVEAELRARGHEKVAPDLPADDDSLTLDDYADTVAGAVGDRRSLRVVAHSFGGFTAPLVADRVPTDMVVFVAGMIPTPGEAPRDWWDNTGYPGSEAGLDTYQTYYQDVPRALAEEAMSRQRAHPSETAYNQPWPLDAWPDVPVRFVLCSEDRFFPPDFFRRLVPERLGITPDETPGGHCAALSRPKELAELLTNY
jgi:hypothetical protein